MLKRPQPGQDARESASRLWGLTETGTPLLLLVAASLAFYLSPFAALSLMAGVVFAALAWWRLDIALLLVPATAPVFRFPKTLEIAGLLGRGGAVEVSLVEFALLGCLAGWGIRFVRGPRPALRREALLPPGLFVAAALISLPFSENRQVALREFRVVVLEPAIYYLLVVSSFRSAAEVGRMLWVLVGTGSVIAAYTFYHYLFVGITTETGGVRRALAVYHSPNALALFLGRIIPIAAALATGGQSGPGTVEAGATAPSQRGPMAALTIGRRVITRDLHPPPDSRAVQARESHDGESGARRGPARRRILERAAAVAACLLMLAATVVTFSRGAVLGIGVAIGFLLFAANRRWAFAAAISLVVLAFAALQFLPLERLAEGGTAAQRLYVWQAAVAMGLDHPITGVGLDNFLYQYPKYMLPEAALEPDMSHPHNLFLDFWTRLGILGLAAFAWLQYVFWSNGAALLRATQAPREYVLALTASMLDFLVHGLVDNSYFLIDLAYIYWLTLALMTVLRVMGDERGLA